jgi:hypothetical protein
MQTLEKSCPPPRRRFVPRTIVRRQRWFNPDPLKMRMAAGRPTVEKPGHRWQVSPCPQGSPRPARPDRFVPSEHPCLPAGQHHNTIRHGGRTIGRNRTDSRRLRSPSGLARRFAIETVDARRGNFRVRQFCHALCQPIAGTKMPAFRRFPRIKAVFSSPPESAIAIKIPVWLFSTRTPESAPAIQQRF